jgi:hypothetical protein
MDRTVRPVPDRTVTVDQTGPDRDRGTDRTGPWPDRALSRSGPTVGRSSLHPKMDRADPSRADPWTVRDRGPDRPRPDPRTGPCKNENNN